MNVVRFWNDRRDRGLKSQCFPANEKHGLSAGKEYAAARMFGG
jgi:hypothetical protein